MKKKISKVITPAVLAASFTVNSFGVSALANDDLTISKETDVTDEMQDGKEDVPVDKDLALPEDPLDESEDSKKQTETEPDPEPEPEVKPEEEKKEDTIPEEDPVDEADEENEEEEKKPLPEFDSASAPASDPATLSDLKDNADEDFEFSDEDQVMPMSLANLEEDTFYTGKECFLHFRDGLEDLTGLQPGDIQVEIYSEGQDESPLMTVENEDETGVIAIEDIDDGSYRAVITKAPEGYLTGEEQLLLKHIDMESEDDGQDIGDRIFYWHLKKEPTAADNYLEIIIKDEETQLPISGMKVELLKDGETVGEAQTTSDDGTVKFIDLDPDDYSGYSLKFVEVPEEYSYLKDTTKDLSKITSIPFSLSFTVAKNAEQVKERTIEITAKDQKTGKPIIGASFYVEENDEEKVSSLTDGTGKATITGLTGTEYTVKEKSMPAGYTVEEERSAKITFREGVATMSGSWEKLSDEDKTIGIFLSLTNKGEAASGIKLKLYQYKADGDHKGDPYTEGSEDGFYTSDEDGVVKFGKLPAGQYYIEFIDVGDYANPGHMLMTISEKQAAADGVKIPMEVKLASEITSGEFVLHLYGRNSAEDPEMNPIGNATVVIKSSDEKGYNETYHTEADGTLNVSDLPLGAYTYAVTEAGAYATSGEEFPFTLSADQYHFEDGLWLVAKEERTSFNLKLTLYKTGDDSKTPLVGTIAGKVLSEDKEREIKDFSIQNGEDITDLEPGTYYIKLTQVPDGYAIPGPFPVTIKNGDTSMNMGIPEASSTYTLNVKVKGLDGTGISGVKVKFTYADGSDIGDGTYTSGADGVITIPGVNQDSVKYQIVEVPEESEYILDKSTYIAKPGGVSAERSLDITLYKAEEVNGTVKITFYDSTDTVNKTPIEGFTIKVYKGRHDNSSPDLRPEDEIKTLSSDGTTITVTDLEAGEYTVIIESAPEGYSKATSIRGFFSVSTSRTVNQAFPMEHDEVVTTCQYTIDVSDGKKFVPGLKYLILTNGKLAAMVANGTIDSEDQKTFSLEYGNYKIQLIPPEGYKINGPTEQSITINSPEDSLPVVLAEMKGKVTFTVLDEEGNQPTEDINIQMDRDGVEPGEKPSLWTNAQDEDNTKTTTDIKAGEWSYTAKDEKGMYEIQSGTVTVTDEGNTPEEVRLKKVKRDVLVKTNVTDENVKVEIMDIDRSHALYTQTGTGGEIRIQDVDAGNYILNVSSDNYITHGENLDVLRDTACASENTIEKTVDLEKKTATVHFNITGAKPDDNPQVTVKVWKEGQDYPVKTGDSTSSSLDIEDLEYGTYYYTYTVSNGTHKYKSYTGKEKTFTVNAQTPEQTITLEESRESAKVTFNVLDDSGEAVTGDVQIKIEKEGHSDQQTLTVSEDGNEVDPAAYTYEVTDADAKYIIGQKGSFDVTDDDKTVDITLPVAVGSATVSVHDDSGRIVSGATVKLEKQGEGDSSQEVPADGGTAVFNNLKAGTYDVTITAPDGYTVNEGSQSITIDRNNLTGTASFTLTQEKTTFTFNISASGREESGIEPTVKLHIYRKEESGSQTLIGTYSVKEWDGDSATLSLELPDGNYHCWYQVTGTGLWNSNIPGFDFEVKSEEKTDRTITLIKKSYAMYFQAIILNGGPGTDIKVKYTVDDGDEKYFTIKAGQEFLFGRDQDESGEATALEPGKKYSFEIVDLPEGYTIAKDKDEDGKMEFTMSEYLPYGVRSGFYIDYHSHKEVTFDFQDENGEAVPGVEYTITRLDGEDYKGESSWTGTTEGNNITKDLEYGSYSLTVTAPEGYKLNGSDFVSFDVSNSSKDITTKFYKLIYGSATINVKNDGAEVTTPVTVQLTGPNGTSSLVINGGTTTIPKLEVGNYTVSVIAADGYLIDHKSYSFTIENTGEVGTDANVEISLMTTEQAENTYSAFFTLTDKDAEPDAEPPKGTLKIYKDDGRRELIGEYQFVDGKVTVNGLSNGRYDYVLEPDEKYKEELLGGNFTIEDGNLETINLKVTEKKGTLTVTTTLTEAKGVTVTIGEDTQPLVNGQAKFENLPYGEYEMYIYVPDGYVLSGSSVRHIVIDQDTERENIALSTQLCSIRVNVTDEFTGLPLKATAGGKLTVRNKDTGIEYIKDQEIKESSYAFVKGQLPYGRYEYEVTFTDGIHETTKGEFITEYIRQLPVDISIKHKTGEMTVHFTDQHQTEITDEDFYVTFEFAEEASGDPNKKPKDVVVKAGETVTMSRGKYDYEVHVSEDAEPKDGEQIVFDQDEKQLYVMVQLKAADLTDLKAAIAEGKSKEKEKDLYTEHSWSNLESAISEAEELVNRENELTIANDPEIEAAAEAIRTAVSNLTEKEFADLDDLKAVLKEAQEMLAKDIYKNNYDAKESLEWNIAQMQSWIDEAPEKDQQEDVDLHVESSRTNLSTIAYNLLNDVKEEVQNKKNKETIYTQSSLDAYEAAMAKADSAADPDGSIPNMEAAIEALYSVELIEKADYSSLNDLLGTVQDYPSDKYTPETYNVLLNAVKNAEDLNKDLPKSEQQQVDSVYEALNSAITGLEYKPADRLDLLSESLSAAKTRREENKDIYDAESLSRLDTAIETAEGLLNAKADQQTEVDNALTELVNAMTEAKKQLADYTKLNEAKETAGSKNKNAYTVDSYNNLLQALAGANAVPDDLTKDQQSVVDAAVSALEAAMEALEKKMNLTDLRELYEEAEAITNEETYTTDSWDAFVKSRDAAKVYIDQYKGQADDNIPYDEGEQQKIDAATEDLTAKKGALVERADFTKLDDAITDAEEYLQKETDYTQDSWKAFKTAYEAAQAAASEDRANVPVTDQERLNGLADALTTAIGDLKIDKSNLKEQIDRAIKATLHEEWYKDLTEFFNVFKKASICYAKDDATKEEVDQVTEELKSVVDALPELLKDADYTQLNSTIQSAKTIYEDETYTDQSRQALQSVLNEAEDILKENLKINEQNRVDDMDRRLKEAINALDKKPADTTAMDTAIAEAESKIEEGDYTAKSLADLQEALKKAQDVRNREDLNIDDQNDINTATEELTGKIDALEKLADKTALKDAIESVASYTESDYTKASWSAVTKAKAEAEALLNEEITETDETENHRIADAVTALTDALNALQKVASKKALEDAIAEYESYEASNYTDDSWSKVIEALNTVDQLMGEEEIPESRANEIEEAANALRKALEEAELKPADYTSLEAAFGLISQDISDEKDTYTEETWTPFENAYAEAESLLTAKDLKITEQQRVNDAAKNLTEAFEALTKKPAVYDALDAAIKEAESLDESKYTKASFKEVTDALSAAREVRRDLIIDDQATVDEAAGRLTDAIAALVELADTSALEKNVADVSGLDESIYTEESWAKVQDAIDAAEALLGGEITKDSQGLVDAAVSAIKEAVDDLEKKPADYKDLKETLTEALGFKEEDYTTKSWAALQDAIAKAEAVADDLKIDEQDKIDEAIDSLKAAIEGMRQKSETGTIVLTIKDEDGNPLPNVPFNLSKVKETSGIARIALFRLMALSNEDEIGTFYTDENGVSEISELEFGKYHITANYVTEDGIEVNIDQFIQLTQATAEEDIELLVIAEYPATVTASVGVTDENGNPVENDVVDGIEIEILKDGEVFKSLTTKDGKIEADLPYGTYTARLKSVPEGYEATIPEEEFTVSKDNKTFDLQLKISEKQETPVTPSKPESGISGGYSGSSDSDSGSSSSSTKNGAVNGTWTYNAATDKWTLNDHQFKSQWVYAYNAYASADQGQYDWFYFDANGEMVTGWYIDVDGNTYYLRPTSDGTRGAMETGWKWIDGKCYYFHEKSDGTKGHLLKGTTTPDGYTVDATGAWTVDGTVVER